MIYLILGLVHKMEHLPYELKNKIKDYIIFKPYTKKELQNIIDLWCENKENAIIQYGHISNWDTSLITDMSYLFIILIIGMYLM